MSVDCEPSTTMIPVSATVTDPAGARKNGKQWKPTKTQFRPGMSSARKSYEARQVDRIALAAMKAREKEMKDEKVQARADLVAKIKEKREKKAEKERFEKLAVKMHAKKVERLRRREKRNKALKER
ncbi:hypothetical protein EDC01DRAFT_174685 [Geopyxis carbonaria]|nr:hypothetical protein EDC01DRAFT_174685 [Geopyxis carbonaria]